MWPIMTSNTKLSLEIFSFIVFSFSLIRIFFILQHLNPIASVTVMDWEDRFMIDVCVNVCLIGNVL